MRNVAHYFENDLQPFFFFLRIILNFRQILDYFCAVALAVPHNKWQMGLSEPVITDIFPCCVEIGADLLVFQSSKFPSLNILHETNHGILKQI